MTERRIGDMVAVQDEGGQVYLGIINAVGTDDTYTVDLITDGVYRRLYDYAPA